jgi:nucleoside-diphosphate-sugar epimerase
VLTVWSELQQIVQADIEPELVDLRAGELQHSCMDVSKADRDLGWRAQVPLREGLRNTYDALVEEFARA